MTKIFVAGHNGMVGSSILRQLKTEKVEIITVNRDELDLIDQSQVKSFFSKHKFDQVYLAAAKVGGIYANNSYPADFIYQNLMIQNNVIHSAYTSGVTKLLFLGSSCIYPRLSDQPIVESQLLLGSLEETNEPYAIAKIAGIKMCESFNRQYGVDYRSIMPTNLYGPGDNYHPENSHVVPALIRRFHEAMITGAEEVVVWGSGSALREFLFVDDMARASIHSMNIDAEQLRKVVSPMQSHLNVGSGVEVSIAGLASLISKTVGFAGKIKWDTGKPDGTPRKILDSTKLNKLGWKNYTNLTDGISQAYEDFLEHQVNKEVT